MAKTCFVISPIGTENSDTRDHADDVFDFIIAPAAERAGYTAKRGDHSGAPGKITEQMFHSILNDDLIVAIITDRNPNVFYELAVAQSAARPTIILNLKGQDIPFDIKDMRVLEYDLRPRTLMKHTYADLLLESIRQVELPENKLHVPFGPDLAPLGRTDDRITLFDSSENVSTSRVIQIIEAAKKRFWIMGVSQYWWLKRENLLQIIKRKAEGGCDMRILMMSEDNPALPIMLRDSQSQLPVVENEIGASFDGWSRIGDEFPNIQVRKVRTGLVLQSLNISENEMYYTPYLVSVSAGHCPGIIANSMHPYFDKLAAEFEYLWDQNS